VQSAAPNAQPAYPTPEPALATRPRESRVTMQDGRQLFVVEYGPRQDDLPPLLCLPGLTRNRRDFEALAKRLSTARRIVMADMRGRGNSDHDPNPKNYAADKDLSDVLHLLDALRLHDCIILGTSFGGFLAMGVALARPRALRGVILNDVGPHLESGAQKFILDYVTAMKPQPDWAAAAAYARDLIGHGWDKDDNTWQRLARQSYVKGPDGILRLDYDPGIAWPLKHMRSQADQVDLWALFGALKNVPTLALRGALSGVLLADTLIRMADAKPDLQCVTVPGVGHAPLLDEPAALVAIDEFLDGV